MQTIPALSHGENSWICTNGKQILEVYLPSDVTKLASWGWVVKTAGEHLASLNKVQP